ncbi:glycosyltransferase [Lysinibacillus pakistanensis]|uniref:glycosyltransferase n=1 Tax=Lysinibacillus pakistanensis TaxID=759811 RepID=UPI003D2664A0
MRINSVKYSINRKKAFQLKTIIYEEKNSKYVLKEAYSQAAKSHLENIYNNYEVYKKSSFNPVEVKMQDKGIVFPFVEGVSLDEILVQKLFNKDKNGFIEKLKWYKTLFLKEEQCAFYQTTDFKNIFGDASNLEGIAAMNLANVDLNFDNIIFLEKDTKIITIDYEWVFKFPIPIDYIIYRAILIFKTKYSGHFVKELVMEEIFELLEIEIANIPYYEEMESNFSKYVGKDFDEYKLNYLKNNIKINELYNEQSPKDFMHIFVENESEELNYNMVAIELNNEYKDYCLKLKGLDFNKLRLEPCYQQSVISLEKIEIYSKDIAKEDLQLIKTMSSQNMYKDLEIRNLIKLPSNNSLELVSLGKHPIIYINNISQTTNSELHVNIRLKIIRGIPENLIGDMSNIGNENESLKQLVNKKNLEITHFENEILSMKNEISKVEFENQLVNKQLESLKNSKSWRITEPFRMAGRTLRTGKNQLKVVSRRFKRFTFLFAKKLPSPLREVAKKVYLNRVNQKAMLKPETELINKKGLKKVSIIIPVYNNIDYLESCILSAVNQTYENKEVILVDDCSPMSEVEKILNKFKHYDFVHIYKNERNMGISATQNVCLAKATGDIIAFLDCDDILMLNAVEESLKYWEPDTKYSFSNRIHINDESQEIGRFSCDHLPKDNIFDDHLDVKMYASHFKLISKDAFEKVGIFNSEYDGAQDYDMVLRVAFHYPNSAFVHVPKFLYKHRIHDKQTSETVREKQYAMSINISNQAKMRRDIKNGTFHKFISFIMVSYGKEDQTLMSIQSIKKTVNIPHEIILYENGSSTTCVEFIKKYIEPIPNVRIIYSDKNIGPSLGRKEALKYARTDSYYISLDNDIEVTEGWIEELLVRAEEDENIGSVTCRVTFPNQTLQFTGGFEEINDGRVEFKLYNINKNVHDLSTLERYNTDWNPVGATLFKGWFPIVEGYPNVYEDAAISYKLRKEGKMLVNSPNSLLIHHHIMFDEERKEKEQDYLNFRYHPKLMLKSISQFYIDNNLIINDDYVFSTNGLNNRKMNNEEIIDIFQQSIKEEVFN